VRYSYDCRGLLAEIADWVGGSTKFTYDDARQLVSIERPNGVVTRYAYDADGHLTGIGESQGGDLSSILLERDAAGKITAAERNTPLAAVLPGESFGFSYDAGGQLADGTYDKLGRPLNLGGRTYRWDMAYRLVSYDGADGSASFTYDAAGLLASRTAGETTETYVWNRGLAVPSVSIVRSGSADRTYYVHLPGGRLLYSIDASDNGRRYYHFDEMANTLFLTGDDGAITDRYAYSPYGERVEHSGTGENPFTFMGAYGAMQQAGAPLYYMRSRFYDGATRRFLSADPLPRIGAGDLNPYQYARSNPMLYIDPEGLGNARRAEWGEAAGIPRLVLTFQEQFNNPGGAAAFRQLLLSIQEYLTGVSR
jgi:RHS repeat-associated protein